MNKKILFFIIFIIIISFIGNLARKTYIIYKYDKQMKEYSQITNFHQKYKIISRLKLGEKIIYLYTNVHQKMVLD